MINLINALTGLQGGVAGASGGNNSPVVSFLNTITQTVTNVGANVLS